MLNCKNDGDNVDVDMREINIDAELCTAKISISGCPPEYVFFLDDTFEVKSNIDLPSAFLGVNVVNGAEK